MIVKRETKVETQMKSIKLTDTKEFDLLYAITSLAEEVCVKIDYDWSYEDMVGYVVNKLMRDGNVSVDEVLKYLGREER